MACLNFDNISDHTIEMQEPSIDMDKLSYEIFSILENKFLFGCDDHNSLVPNQEAEVVSGENEVEAIKNQRGKICILSVDGGGNILLGKAMSYLEGVLKNKSGNPNASLADYFDVAAGTGVGGVLTAMLFATVDHSRPIFNAENAWKFLAAEDKKPKTRSANKGNVLKRIFRRTGASSSAASGFEQAMKEAFRDEKRVRNLTLKDTLKPVLIPCYDLASSAPFLFSRADALETDGFDFNLWEVCMATAAEPGIFDPVCMHSVDGSTRCVGVNGGLAMNNPTAAAITHVLHNKEEFPFVRGLEDILVLSLGAGEQLVEGSFDLDKVRKWKASDWARPLVRISGNSSAELMDQAVAMAFGQNRDSNYVRIQMNGSNASLFEVNVDSNLESQKVKVLAGADEDILKQKNVESVLFGGKKIGEQSHFEKLDWFAEHLVLEHQRRSCRKAPTVAFKQSNPKP